MDKNTKVIQEYQNKRVHSVVQKKKSDLYDYYCDSELIELNETVCMEKDFHMQGQPFSKCIYYNRDCFLQDHPDIVLKEGEFSKYTATIPLMMSINDEEIEYNISVQVYMLDNKIFYLDCEKIDFVADKITLTYENIEYTEHTDNKNIIILSGDFVFNFYFYVCPRCGKIITSVIRLSFLKYYTVKTGEYIFNNPENIKHSVMFKMIMKIRGKVHCMQYKHLYIFSKKNLRLYYIGHRYITGSSALKNMFKQKFINITWRYSDSFGTEDILAYVNKYLLSKYEDEFKFFKKDLDNISNLHNRVFSLWKEYSYYSLFYLKKTLNIKNNYLLYFIYKLRYVNKDIIKQLKNKNDNEILKFLFINKKLFYTKSFYVNFDFNRYCYAFPYINNTNDTKLFIKSPAYPMYIYEKGKRNNFIYIYGKKNSKTRFFNQLIKTESNILSDSCMLYKDLKKEIPDYKVDWNDSISYLHDIMSKDYNRIKKENRELPIDEELKKIIDSFDDFHIKYSLAKDTDELVHTGSFMNICVGGYRNLALSSESLIVIGYENGNPVTCMEFTRNKNKLIICQVKKKYNNYADKEENDYLIYQFKKNKIKINTSDIKERNENVI